MGNKLKCISAVLSVVLLVAGSTSMAAKTATITGKLETDKVELKAGLVSDGKEVLPGTNAEQILDVQNTGSDCYIRITPSLMGEKEDIEKFVFDTDKDWIFTNGSFYYTKVLKGGKTVRFCEKVKVPEDIIAESVDFSYRIDGIQSANFEPEFTALNPWGNVEIVGVKDRFGNVKITDIKASKENSESLDIYYNDEARLMITNFDEIFKDIPIMSPGDYHKEVIELKNKSDDEKTLYLSDISDSAEVLKYIKVKIYSDINGKINNLYEGDLGTPASGAVLNVGTLLPKEEGEIVIETEMDKNAGNEASSLSTHLTLATWVESVDKGADGEGEKTDRNNKKPELNIRSAKTGEGVGTSVFLIIAGVLMFAGFIFVTRRE